MKAQEYVEKYGEQLNSEDKEIRAKAVKGLVNEMIEEAFKIAEIRHVKFDRGFISIVKEQNQKWNAISTRLNGLLKKDAFTEIINDMITKK